MPVLGGGLNYIRTDRTSAEEHIHSVVARHIGLVARGFLRWLLSDSGSARRVFPCPRRRILKSSTTTSPDVRLPSLSSCRRVGWQRLDDSRENTADGLDCREICRYTVYVYNMEIDQPVSRRTDGQTDLPTDRRGERKIAWDSLLPQELPQKVDL